MNAAEVVNRYRHGAVADGQDPDASSSADLGNGPGIQEVATFSADVSGASGAVAVAPTRG